MVGGEYAAVVDVVGGCVVFVEPSPESPCPPLLGGVVVGDGAVVGGGAWVVTVDPVQNLLVHTVVVVVSSGLVVVVVPPGLVVVVDLSGEPGVVVDDPPGTVSQTGGLKPSNRLSPTLYPMTTNGHPSLTV